MVRGGGGEVESHQVTITDSFIWQPYLKLKLSEWCVFIHTVCTHSLLKMIKSCECIHTWQLSKMNPINVRCTVL